MVVVVAVVVVVVVVGGAHVWHITGQAVRMVLPMSTSSHLPVWLEQLTGSPFPLQSAVVVVAVVVVAVVVVSDVVVVAVVVVVVVAVVVVALVKPCTGASKSNSCCTARRARAHTEQRTRQNAAHVRHCRTATRHHGTRERGGCGARSLARLRACARVHRARGHAARRWAPYLCVGIRVADGGRNRAGFGHRGFVDGRICHV